jgi:Rab GDP dissociation inhibitor
MEDTNFDVVVCGTGLTECVLSGLLSINGYKVLHLDRNRFYGGEGASLNLLQLFEEFKKPPADEAKFGKNMFYNVDLVPKALMADGEMVKIMRATVVERYQMEFMLLEGSFVLKEGKVHKVPANDREALASGLMGFFEKRRAAKFFSFCQTYDPSKPTTKTMEQVYKDFGLEANTIEFIGHAVALHDNDDYIKQPAHPTIMRCRLYDDSISSYGQSPYVYPVYGLGELPATFSRLCAVYNGTYILGADIQQVNMKEGAFDNIVFTFPDGDTRSPPQTIQAKCIIGDPSYFPDRVRSVAKIVRCICICSTPIQVLPKGHENCASCQVIIPQSEFRRSHDIYVLQLSGVHKVCPADKYLVLVSTVLEGPDPAKEVEPVLAFLKATVLEKFIKVSDMSVATDDGKASKCFVTNSFDSATHFEASARNVLEVFERVHGTPYNFDAALTKMPGQGAQE